MSCFLAVLLFMLFAPELAFAHLDLQSPKSRYGANALKEGPCGKTGGGRSGNVTIFEPGQSIEVVFKEYVDHPGHFRISFDEDGDDGFVDPKCLAGCTTTTPAMEFYSSPTVLLDQIADTNGGETRVQVTLPNVECENCTLQAIQVMYDKPPYSLPGNDIYYQCADLVLREGGGDGKTEVGCECAAFESGRVDTVPLSLVLLLLLAGRKHGFGRARHATVNRAPVAPRVRARAVRSRPERSESLPGG